MLAGAGPGVADDMHPAYVGLLLDEGLLAAGDVLERLWPADTQRSLAALHGRLALLQGRAPQQLRAVLDRLPPGPRAEQLGWLHAIDGDPELMRAAEAALGETRSPLERARGLLALGRVAPAMALLPALKIWDLARLARDHAQVWNDGQRAQVRALAVASPDRAWAAELGVALALVGPPAEAREDALWVLARRFDGTRLNSAWRLPALTRVLPFADMRFVVDPHLRAARGLWDAFSVVPSWAPLAAPDQLDAMVTMIDEGRGYPWDKLRLLALVARHHPPRHDELLARAKAGLPKLISPPGAGAGVNPAPVGGGGVATVHQVHLLAGLAAASRGDERRALQRAALERLASDLDYEELETVCPYMWPWVGAAQDPSLHAPCVEVLLRLLDRHTCWGALAGVVAGYPAPARTLALAGLRRLAEA